MFDILGLIALFAVTVLTIGLAIRAWRANNKVVKWVGLVLSSLFALVFTLGVGVALVGFYRINFPPHRPAVTEIRVAGTPDQLARGARFGAFCAMCHATNGKPPLVGQNFGADGGPSFGTLYAANLTPAGEIKDWSDGEVIRAIREGVHQSGRTLVVMPSEVFRNLSDDDVQAIVAYLRSQPAAGPATPPTNLNVLAAILVGAGIANTSVQPPITQPVVAPAKAATADYGRYLTSVLGCKQCHGQKLAGGKTSGPGPPAGPNLTMIIPKWGADDFIHTLRTGVDPASHKLAAGMPWKEISAFATDEDLKAIYIYLHGLKPIEGPTK